MALLTLIPRKPYKVIEILLELSRYYLDKKIVNAAQILYRRNAR